MIYPLFISLFVATLAFYPTSATAAPQTAVLTPQALLTGIRQALSNRDTKALLGLCRKADDMRASNEAKNDPEVAAGLAAADALLKKNGVICPPPGRRRPVAEEQNARNAPVVSLEGLRDAVADSAAYFDGDRKRTGSPVVLVRAVVATAEPAPKDAEPASKAAPKVVEPAPAPVPKAPKPKKGYCRSNLEGYLEASDPAVRRGILLKTSAVLVARAGVPDEDGTKASCFTDKAAEYLAGRDLSCVRTSVDADGVLSVIATDQAKRSTTKVFGRVADLDCGKASAPAPKPAPRAEKPQKPVRPCKSNLEGFLGSSDPEERMGILKKTSALIILRSEVADEDGKKADCFSKKVAAFVAGRDLSCVRTSADRSGTLTLVYTDKKGKEAIQTFGTVAELDCDAAPLPPVKKSEPPPAPPPAPRPKKVSCEANIDPYRAARARGEDGRKELLLVSRELLRARPSSAEGDGNPVSDLAYCLGYYFKANPPPVVCPDLTVDKKGILLLSRVDPEKQRVFENIGEMDAWTARACVAIAAEYGGGGGSRGDSDSGGGPGNGSGGGSGGSGGSGGGGWGSGNTVTSGGPVSYGNGSGGSGGGSPGGAPAAPASPAHAEAAPWEAAPREARPAPAAAAAAPGRSASAPPERGEAPSSPVPKAGPPGYSWAPTPMTGATAGGDLPLPRLGTPTGFVALRDAAAEAPVRKRAPRKKPARKIVKAPRETAKTPRSLKPAPQPLQLLPSPDEALKDALNAGMIPGLAVPVAPPGCGIIPIWDDAPPGWTSGTFPPKRVVVGLHWTWAVPLMFQVVAPTIVNPRERLTREPNAAELAGKDGGRRDGGAYPNLVCEDDLTEAPPGWMSGSFPNAAR